MSDSYRGSNTLFSFFTNRQLALPDLILPPEKQDYIQVNLIDVLGEQEKYVLSDQLF